MRWLVVLILVATGAALGAAGLLLLRDEGPEDLLPDVVARPPSGLEIVQVGDTYHLAFVAPVENRGRGPLALQGSRPDAEADTMSVRQLVRSSDGSERARTLDAEMRYGEEGDDGRWLLYGLVRYGLLAEDEEPVWEQEEAGLCLGDRRPAGETAAEPLWTEDCGGGEPGLLSVAQGVSPGWRSVDGDGRLLVNITSVPAGRYVLVHAVDPGELLADADRGNDASSLLIELERRAGQIPSVRVLARCPGTSRCAD
jgi:hypothetical protein